MHKYDVWFCHCGTLQFMPEEYYNWLQEDYANRTIIRVCQHCGRAQKVWLEPYDNGYCVGATGIKDVEMAPDDLANTRIIFDSGVRVPVKNGEFEYATSYFANRYIYNNEFADVDVDRLIRDINDEEKTQSVAAYLSGIDWKGTPYEHTYA